VYGGPTYSVSALAEELARQGNIVTVQTTNANGTNDFQYPSGTSKIINGVRVIYYRRISGDPTSVSPAHTWALMKSIRQFDIVHIQGWWNWVAMMSLIICKIYGVPHVLSPRGALSEYTFQTQHTKRTKKWLHRFLFKGMLTRTLLHVTSSEEARKFREVLPKARIVTIPNIVDIPGKWKRLNVKHEPLQILFLGRIDQVKNLELLIHSLEKVSFPYILSIAGDGDPIYIEHLKNLITHNHQIKFLGPVYDTAKFEFLANSDVLVLLSHTENFGNVVIESLSQGTAVLVSKNVGAADIVEVHDLGWIIQPDLKTCVDTLNIINLDRKRLEDIRQRGPQVIAAEFNPDTLATRYINECYSIVNPNLFQVKETAKVV
jgi:glycosyltransferase involved in cell wall biosynthesis